MLAFLAAQVSLVLHNIEHGVLEHTHAGKQCEQCVFAKHFSIDTPNVAFIIVALFEHKASYIAVSPVLVSKEQSRSNLARAPPSILLS